MLLGGRYLPVGVKPTSCFGSTKEVRNDYLVLRSKLQPLPESIGWGAGQLQKGSSEGCGIQPRWLRKLRCLRTAPAKPCSRIPEEFIRHLQSRPQCLNCVRLCKLTPWEGRNTQLVATGRMKEPVLPFVALKPLTSRSMTLSLDGSRKRESQLCPPSFECCLPTSCFCVSERLNTDTT